MIDIMQLTNLYNRLKPDVVSLIDKEAQIYPNTVEILINSLKNNYLIPDLPIRSITTLTSIPGIEDIMGITNTYYSERFLLINLKKLLIESE
jgi:hypothetical protein